MRKQYVIVEAWVPDTTIGEGHPEHPIVIPPEQPETPPGYPAHPIYYPPTVWPPAGHPAHPIAPGGPGRPVDPGYGVPGPPYYRPEHPIYYPPGIWGPTDPRPGWGLPDGGTGGSPPGIWGPPGPWPSPPIYFPGGPVDPGYGVPGPPYPQPPGFWGGGSEGFPTPPINLPPPGGGGRPPGSVWPPLPIVPPEGERPEHPEVPDLNAGNWLFVTDGVTFKRAFVPWPLAVTHPDYNPNYPPEETQPGEWVTVIYGGQLSWAWIPSAPSSGGGDGGGDGGNEQRVAKKAPAAS